MPTIEKCAMLESIYNWTISELDSNQLFKRSIAKISLRLIKKISSFHDPLINYRLNSYDIKIPLSHSLPIVLKQYPDYAKNLARVASCVYHKYPHLTIIDIGANIGDSVFILKEKVPCPILCIEGDSRFFQILQINTAACENVSIKQVFVGTTDEQANKELVIVAGTAHFAESNNTTTTFQKLSSILSTAPEFLNSKLVKIDTDGFDLSIIRGSLDFIQTIKPVLFFEYDPFFLAKQNDDGIYIFAQLHSLGYHSAAIYDNFGSYLISVSLKEQNQIADLHRYLLGRNGEYYYDICLVHEEDLDIISQLREVEIAFSM
jgi:FkbM family methyltransferase